MSKKKERILFNKSHCPVYTNDVLHNKIMNWKGKDYLDVPPQEIEMHCDGEMHNWNDNKGGCWSLTCQDFNKSNYAFIKWERDNKLESVGG